MARRIKDYDEDYDEDYVGNMTPLGVALRIVGLAVVLIVIGTLIGIPLGWFQKGAEIISPDNVEEQYAAIYQDYQALEKGAQNVCDLRVVRDSSSTADEKTQRVSQVLASQQLYNRNAADYDARWQNVFEAKLVGPNDVPTTAPTLNDMIAFLGLTEEQCPSS
jgi:hypothetical protein